VQPVHQLLETIEDLMELGITGTLKNVEKHVGKTRPTMGGSVGTTISGNLQPCNP